MGSGTERERVSLNSDDRAQQTEGKHVLSHETLTGDSRRGHVDVRVRGVGVDGEEDVVNSENDEDERDAGTDPVDEAVLSEGEDEDTDGEEGTEDHGTVESCFGNGDAVVLSGGLVVHRVLPESSTKSDETTDDERDVGETRIALGPASVLLEGDGDGREEEEDKSPGEGNPETEQEDDGLSEQELERSEGRVSEELGDRVGLELHGGTVSVVARLLSQLGGSSGQNDCARHRERSERQREKKEAPSN